METGTWGLEVTYLCPINNTAVTNIKRMHDEYKYKGLKYSLAGISKYEYHNHNLGWDDKKDFRCRNAHQQ